MLSKEEREKPIEFGDIIDEIQSRIPNVSRAVLQSVYLQGLRDCESRIADAVKLERERCAEICRKRAKEWHDYQNKFPNTEVKSRARDEAVKIYRLILNPKEPS